MNRYTCTGLMMLALCAPALHAQQTTLYQCTASDGSMTLRDDGPCPPGEQQRIRIIEVPPPVTLRPPHVADEPATLLPPEALLPLLRGDDDTVSAAAEPGPPPPLFQCSRYDQTRYFHDDGEPEPHCVPLNTVGIGGLAGIGAGQACERIRDDCEPVPEHALCQAWETRLREAEFRWKFSNSRREMQTLHAEYERLALAWAGSTCRISGD